MTHLTGKRKYFCICMHACISGFGQALGKSKRIRPSVGQKWPENSPAGEKVSGSGQPLGKNDPKIVPRGKIKRIRPSVGQKWPENSPAGQKVSGIGQALGKNEPKTIQRCSGALRIYAST